MAQVPDGYYRTEKYREFNRKTDARVSPDGERRAPQKWWEKAEAGKLVSKDFTGGDAA